MCQISTISLRLIIHHIEHHLSQLLLPSSPNTEQRQPSTVKITETFSWFLSFHRIYDSWLWLSRHRLYGSVPQRSCRALSVLLSLTAPGCGSVIGCKTSTSFPHTTTWYSTNPGKRDQDESTPIPTPLPSPRMPPRKLALPPSTTRSFWSLHLFHSTSNSSQQEFLNEF